MTRKLIKIIDLHIKINEKFGNSHKYYLYNGLNPNAFKNLNYFIKNANIILKIPSEIKYSYNFIVMIMLLEKITNNKSIFLYDKYTLSRKNVIKIGLRLNIKKNILENFLKSCLMYFIPKYYEETILFNVSHNVTFFYYLFDKILSNSVYSYDKKMHLYYIYVNEFPYKYSIQFISIYKSIYMNKLMTSTFGVNKLYNSVNYDKTISDISEKMVKEEELIDNKMEDDLLIINDDELNNELDNKTNNNINNTLETEETNEKINTEDNTNYIFIFEEGKIIKMHKNDKYVRNIENNNLNINIKVDNTSIYNKVYKKRLEKEEKKETLIIFEKKN